MERSLTDPKDIEDGVRMAILKQLEEDPNRLYYLSRHGRNGPNQPSLEITVGGVPGRRFATRVRFAPNGPTGECDWAFPIGIYYDDVDLEAEKKRLVGEKAEVPFHRLKRMVAAERVELGVDVWAAEITAYVVREQKKMNPDG